MKFRKFGQIILASVVSLGLAAGITACSTSRTIDYVYVISSKNTPGQINVYQVDSQSGALHPISGSPFSMSHSNPTALVVSPDSKYLYVAYQTDNVIEQYAINTSGQLSEVKSVTTPGSSPVALAMNGSGTYLYVVDTYQPGFSSTNAGTGGALIAYPVSSTDGSLGTAVSNGSLSYFAVGANPTAVNALANNGAVFVTEKNDGTYGSIHAFVVGSTGALTAMGSSSLGTGIYKAGVQPSSIISDLSSNYVYVSDYKQNQILGYTVQSGTSLVSMTNSPFTAGNQPINLTIDPRNKYMYIANFTDATLSGYEISSSTGSLTSLAGGLKAGSTKPEPTCVFLEPALARYVYATNSLDNTISGFQLDPNTGALTTTEGSVVQAAAGPVCGVSIAHGNHSTQHVDTGN